MDLELLREWIGTDEGKAWLDKQTEPLRNDLGNTKGKLGEMEQGYRALETQKTELEQQTAKLLSDLEKAQKARDHKIDPNEELQAQIAVLTQNLEEAKTQGSKLQKQMLNERLSTLINDEITKQGGNPRVLGIHVRRQLVAELDEEGNLVVFAVDENGKKAFDSEAKPAGVSYVVSQLKQDDAFKASFKAPVKSGSGHIDHDDPKPHEKNGKSFTDMSREELSDTNALKSALFKR